MIKKVSKPYSSLPNTNIIRNFLADYGIGKDSHQVIDKKLSTEGYADVGFICGADVFAPRKVLNEVGFFDPDIFMFAEEIDLAKRMECAGYSRIVIKNYDIVHLGSSSFTKEKLLFKKYYWSTLSISIYSRKHFKGLGLFNFRIHRLMMIIRDVYCRKSVDCNRKQRHKLMKVLFRSDIGFDSYFEEV